MAFQSDAFQGDAFQVMDGPVSGSLDAVFAPSFAAAFTGAVSVVGILAASFAPAFTTSVAGQVKVAGALSGTAHLNFVASFTGTSEGLIPIIPRDVEGGIDYLIEIGAYEPVGATEVTLYFGSGKMNTLPTDTLANQHFDNRVKLPGDYTRSMFSDGTTSGAIEVGTGIIDLVNNDGGLDALINYAFDGRPLIIRSVERARPLYAQAVTVFIGTVEQIEFTWGRATVRLRDRLAELDKQLQTAKFAGTTISGGLNEAEGKPDDLKDQPKPLCFGAPMSVSAVASNTFDHIYDLGSNGLQAVAEVRDRGVALTATGIDYATVALLRAATIPEGKYATCLAAGLVRTGSSPQGQVTAAPVEGVNGGARSAAQIARRMLLRMGKIEGTDFLSSDITALDALNNAPLGFWIGVEEMTCLDAVASVLNSIGAAIVPDRLGIFRMYRLSAPVGPAVMTLGKADILEPNTRGIERLATGDQGNGVPAWKVNVKWGRNWSVMSRNELDPVNASESFKSFAELDWRTAVAEDTAVKDVHKLATELTFETYLTSATDAASEAARRLGLYSVRRDRFRVPVPSYLVEKIDIGSVIRLQLPRFMLDAGKNFRVIGMAPNLQTRITTLDLWG